MLSAAGLPTLTVSEAVTVAAIEAFRYRSSPSPRALRQSLQR
jgi:hypothetical protein